SDAALQHGSGNFAGTEAGDADLLRDLAVGAVEVRLQLVERHLDIDLYARRAQLLDGALQRVLLEGLTDVDPVLFAGDCPSLDAAFARRRKTSVFVQARAH